MAVRPSAAVTRPQPADFAPPPDAVARRRWTDADRAHRPERLLALRGRLAAAGIDAYFGVRPEHMRWLTGFTLGAGEDKVAGHSGQFLIGGDAVIIVTDSRYAASCSATWGPRWTTPSSRSRGSG